MHIVPLYRHHTPPKKGADRVEIKKIHPILIKTIDIFLKTGILKEVPYILHSEVFYYELEI